MSQYERRRRSNVLSGDGSRLPNGGNTRVGQRGSGHLAAFSVCLGGRLDKTGTHATDSSRGEAVGKPGVAGVYTNQRLNRTFPWWHRKPLAVLELFCRVLTTAAI